MTTPRIIDISPPITERLAVWPGDAPFKRKVALSIADGSNIEPRGLTASTEIAITERIRADKARRSAGPWREVYDRTPLGESCELARA